MNIFDSNNILKEISIKDDLTIVIITHNRKEFLCLLIDSLAAAFTKYSDLNCDIVFCVNGKDQLTDQYLKEVNNKLDPLHTQIITLDKPATPAEARNIAMIGVHSEWVMFLDDDVEIPPDLFNNFKKLVNSDPQACLWGGPNLTPDSSTVVQKKIGWLLQSYLVTGPLSCRYKLNNIEALECKGTYFSLCNMFVKTQDFKAILFNTTLKTAEENELIYRFAQNNKKMKTSDLLYVWHYRRSSIAHFLAQIKNYGFGRGQLIYNGMMSKSNQALILILICMLLFFLIRFPVLSMTIGFFWVAAIFVNLAFDFRFKQNSVSDVLLPLRLWFNYFVGIIKGLSSSYRVSKL